MQINFNQKDRTTNFKGITQFGKCTSADDIARFNQSMAKIYKNLLDNESSFKTIGDDFTKIIVDADKGHNKVPVIMTHVGYIEPLFQTVDNPKAKLGILKKLAVKLKIMEAPEKTIQRKVSEAWLSKVYKANDEGVSFSSIRKNIEEEAQNVKFISDLQKEQIERQSV